VLFNLLVAVDKYYLPALLWLFTKLLYEKGSHNFFRFLF